MSFLINIYLRPHNMNILLIYYWGFIKKYFNKFLLKIFIKVILWGFILGILWGFH